MDINIQHKNHKMTQALVKKYLFYSILLLLSTFNFQLSTLAQESPFPTEHLQLWLRADSVELTSGKISQWYDLSPNNYVIQQTSANARPTLNNSSVNGLPALIFNGSSNFLTGGNILNIGDKGWSYFVVAKIYNNGGQNWFFSKGDRNNGWVQTGYYNWFLGNSSMLLMNRENISISCSGSQNIYAIYEFELYDRNASTTSTYLNG